VFYEVFLIRIWKKFRKHVSKLLSKVSKEFEKYIPNFLFKGKNGKSEGVGRRVMGGEDNFSICDHNVHPLLL
jgi:hypothetical protein